jgi:hypothetical protein
MSSAQEPLQRVHTVTQHTHSTELYLLFRCFVEFLRAPLGRATYGMPTRTTYSLPVPRRPTTLDGARQKGGQNKSTSMYWHCTRNARTNCAHARHTLTFIVRRLLAKGVEHDLHVRVREAAVGVVVEAGGAEEARHALHAGGAVEEERG